MIGSALLGGVALSVLGAVPAMAHVTVTADEAVAGSYAVLTFSVPHGCEGSSTTRVSIQVPEGINAVTPTRNALWQADKVLEELDTPIEDSHGNTITERVAEVVYTAEEPLPDGYRDAFELSLQLPEESADSTLVFPTVQTCQKGESAWVQVPAAGQDPDELELPAPALEVAASGDDAEASRGAESHDETAGAETPGPWVITALAVGLAGLLTGGASLLRSRSKG